MKKPSRDSELVSVVNKTRIADVACPVARSLEVMGDRWSILILRDLLVQGPRRFQDFSASLTGISPNVLSGRIKKLIDHDVIAAEPYSLHPPRNHYVLTERGRALGPIMTGLRDWGELYTQS